MPLVSTVLTLLHAFHRTLNFKAECQGHEELPSGGGMSAFGTFSLSCSGLEDSIIAIYPLADEETEAQANTVLAKVQASDEAY